MATVAFETPIGILIAFGSSAGLIEWYGVNKIKRRLVRKDNQLSQEQSKPTTGSVLCMKRVKNVDKDGAVLIATGYSSGNIVI